jgi:hypothetical protein
MNPAPTITLRDAARRLPKVLRLHKKTAVSELHGLLKSGDLRAGFQFPARVERWIAIPTRYWSTIGAKDLRTLLYKEGNKKKPGTFEVQISQFTSEFVRLVSEELKNEHEDRASHDLVTNALDEMKEALTASSSRYEVAIRNEDWEDYLHGHHLEEPAPYEPRRGRHQLTGWRDLAILIGAYLLKHYRTTPNEIKIDEAAQKIHQIATARNITGLPTSWTTIKGVLSKS